MAGALEKAIVKCLPGEPNLTITLQLAGRTRILTRPKEELLDKPLGRILKSAYPPQANSRGGKKRQADAAAAAPAPEASQAEPAVVLHEGPSLDSPLLDPATTTNAEAWTQHGRLLVVGEQRFVVELNPPFVERLEVTGWAFVGIPLCPLLTARFAEDAACQWRWFRQPAAAGGKKAAAAAAGEWAAIEGAFKLYTPQPEDAGHLLRVECTPGRRGGDGNVELGEAESAAVGPVRRQPEPLGCATRLALTREAAAPPAFRVLTFNLLADTYASTEIARRELFAHCDPEIMEPEYRRPLLVAEILGYHADVLCLQEVDEKMFTHYLLPQLGEAGYHGLYTNKAGNSREGCALFYRTARFSLVTQRDLTLRQLLPSSLAELGSYKYGAVFEPMLRTSPQLLPSFQRVLTIAQLALLAPVGDSAGVCRPLCVVNSHYFFHPRAGHIRAMHTYMLMQEAQAFMQEAAAAAGAAALGGAAPTLIFCGDLNSSLNEGVPGSIELLRSGRLAADHPSFLKGVGFVWSKGVGTEAEAAEQGAAAAQPQGEAAAAGTADCPEAQEEEEVVAGVELSIPFRLRAAGDLQMPHTHYVPYFKGLLDYVWYCPEDVSVVREVPVLTEEQLHAGLGGFLPSAHMPSDHQAVVFDLAFNPTCQGCY